MTDFEAISRGYRNKLKLALPEGLLYQEVKNYPLLTSSDRLQLIMQSL
ncbi:hypothetical protein [Coleofasciculus sp. FACHB-SPT9]|nr:hypothetical protein [Coleofasciculus sp. FACHB-SPT9]MBD1890313.1 hypothetical protein [Coleofasciculus sp. FACHB-SPT9]